MRALGEALARRGVPEQHFRVPRFGETLVFPPPEGDGLTVR